jgi:hypothetical protein
MDEPDTTRQALGDALTEKELTLVVGGNGDPDYPVPFR